MATARAYLLGKIPEDQKFRGQAGLIHGFLAAATEPQTVAQQVAAIQEDLTTRQDPTRVVSFYMSVWKKKGWVRVVEVEAPAAEAAADTSDEPNNDAESGLVTTADERVVAEMEAAVEAAHLETEIQKNAEELGPDVQAEINRMAAEVVANAEGEETESRSARRRRNRGK